MEAIEGLCFLASLPLAGTGRTEGGEKTQPFNRFHSRLFSYRTGGILWGTPPSFLPSHNAFHRLAFLQCAAVVLIAAVAGSTRSMVQFAELIKLDLWIRTSQNSANIFFSRKCILSIYITMRYQIDAAGDGWIDKLSCCFSSSLHPILSRDG